MKVFPSLLACFALLLLATPLPAQVPQLISYQGRVGVDGVNFDGQGQFKFALVNAAGTTTYWSNDASSNAGGEPGTAVSIAVSKGLYSVLLGDATLTHMTIVPATVFTNGDVHLRVWFNDGVNGFQKLSPDRRIAAVGYAMMADSVPDGAITTAKIADGAVTAEKLAAVTSVNTAGALVVRDTNGNFAAGIITGTLNGNAATATDFTGTLAGDVTGTQSATVLSATAITSRVLTGFTSAAGTVTAGDSILGALGKLDGNLALKSPLASPSFTGSVTLPAGTATSAPLKLQSGSSLTNPVFGAVEFDGTNLFVTNNSGNPARKTVAFTDTPLVNAQIADGTITATKLAAGAVGSAQLAAGAVAANLNASGQAGVPSGGLVLSTSENPALVNAGYTLVSSTMGTTEWRQRVTSSSPEGRSSHTTVWTGSEMIIWGGSNDVGYLGSGARFNPATNSWVPMSNVNAPAARISHSAVWTGSEMIVWGGITSNGFVATGGRYNPATDTWTVVSTNGAPAARYSQGATWTGSEMIIWGGNGPDYLNSGGRYNPVTDMWIQMSMTGAPVPRYGQCTVWTGSEMIVWGGRNHTLSPTQLNTGGRYNPLTNTWTTVSLTNSPEGRADHTGVWTGSEMIVWGGSGAVSGLQDTGGRYNPATNTWITLNAPANPVGRYAHSAVWTGSEMIVWGGYARNGYVNNGGRYDPVSNVWRAVASTGAPWPREGHSAVWTGSEMIIWGGLLESIKLGNDTYSYKPGQTLYLYQRP